MQPHKAQTQAESEMEYIRRNMQQQSMQLHRIGVEAIEAQKQKRELTTQEWLNKQNQRADDGYKTILTEAFSLAKEGSITISDEISPILIEACLIDEHALKTVNDLEKVTKHQESGGTLQQLYGFSTDVMLTFYEIAKQFLTDKKITEAINAFTLLCVLNPYVDSFWISLGLAFEADQNWEEAIDSFEIAIAFAPSSFDPYLGLIRICNTLHDYSALKPLLESALENEAIKNQAKEALEYVQSQEEISTENNKLGS